MWPLKTVDIEDQPARACAGRSRASWPWLGAATGASHDAEVLRAVRVGRDDEPVAVVLDRVLVAVLARRDETRGAFGRVGVDQVDLGRLVVVGVDDDELGRLRLADADVEADVLFLVDEHIVGSTGVPTTWR